jgi:hypothetical protein
VDLLGLQVERGVHADRRPVCLGAAGQVADPGPGLRPGERQDVPLERLAVPAEPGDGDVTDGLEERAPESLAVRLRPARKVAGRRGGELPVARRQRLEPAKDVEHPLDRLDHGDPAIRGGLSQVRAQRVEVPPDPAPSLDHGRAVLRCPDGLVVDRVEDAHDRSLEGVDRPLVDAGPEGVGRVGRLVLEHLARDPLRRVEPLRLDRARARRDLVQPDEPRRDARLRRIVEPVVEAPVTDDRRPRRMGLEELLPEAIAEGAQGCARCRGARHEAHLKGLAPATNARTARHGCRTGAEPTARTRRPPPT